MKKLIVLIVLLLGIALASLGQNKQLQILSYNVRPCAGMDMVVDYDRTASVIVQQQPDVVALQELDSMTGRSGHRDQIGELALRTGYHPIFGAAIEFDGGQYGVGILTREMPVSTKRIPLPGEEPRVLSVVELEDYVIACTHLDLDEAQRMASVPLIVEEAQRWQKLFLLAGDWNDTPDSELIKTMTQYFTVLSDNEATYPADKPNECIDYVAVFNGRAEAIDSHVIDEPEASDHRPLVVWVRLR